MDLNTRAHRLSKYKELGIFLWKYGHTEMPPGSGLDEWLASHGITNGDLNGNGDGQSPITHSENGKNSEFIPEEFIADLEKLGPTYERIAQILSKRPDILPSKLAGFLTSIQFVHTPMTATELDMAVRTELDIPLSEAFPTFDTTPLTVSPFDQTHIAGLRDGRRVIVKVQKPGIIEKVYEELETLSEVADFCDHHTKSGKQIALSPIIDELKKQILSELDYRKESHNLLHLDHALNGIERIVVPAPIGRFSTSRILTIKYIEGRKLSDAPPVGLLAAERAALAGDVFHAYLKQILVDGFVHGDPDPNNMLLTSTGKLALLDLGIINRVTSAMQEKLLQILLAINEGRAETVADAIVNIGNKRENFDEKSFRDRIHELVMEHRDSTSDRLEIGRVFIGIAQAAFRCGITIPFEFGTLGTTLTNLDRIADLLDKNFDSRKYLEHHMTEIMRGQVLKTFTPAHFFHNLIETFELLEKMPGKVGKILDSVAANELKITVDTIDERMLMAGFQKVANRITMGLILASLIMGASQLMQIKTSFTMWGYPGLAIICFLLAAGCGFALVLDIFISDRKTG